jgi:hypothetical protein
MTTGAKVLWLIEDDDLKASTLRRIVQQARPDLELVRLHTLAEWMDVIFSLQSTIGSWATVPSRWAGVITDWSFPRRDGREAQPIGDRVLSTLDGTGVPHIVVSGGDRPHNFTAQWGTVDWLHLGEIDSLRKWLADLGR